MFYRSLGVIVALLLMIGCTRVGPIELHQPISQQKYTLSDIENAIEYAAQVRGWKVLLKERNRYKLDYYTPYNILSIIIDYNFDGYTIKYSDTKDLNQDKLDTYYMQNSKLKLLHKTIRKRLLAIKKARHLINRSSNVTLKRQLVELKHLYEDGLIDEQEYRAKKAQLLKIN